MTDCPLQMSAAQRAHSQTENQPGDVVYLGKTKSTIARLVFKGSIVEDN